jgi:hypothetical protein
VRLEHGVHAQPLAAHEGLDLLDAGSKSSTGSITTASRVAASKTTYVSV